MPNHLYEKLMRLDPASAEKIHPNNHRRLVRALEIIEVTGKTKDDHEEDAGHAPLYDHLIVGLEMDRDVLYERIDRACRHNDGKRAVGGSEAIMG